MNYNTKYFVVNLVVEGSDIDCFSHFVRQKNKRVIRLSYIIIEAKEDVFNNGKFCYYKYTSFCFEGIHIKKSLSAKNVCRLISTDRSHTFSRCVTKPLTDEEILSMIEDEIVYDIIPTTTKSKLYSYNI